MNAFDVMKLCGFGIGSVMGKLVAVASSGTDEIIAYSNDGNIWTPSANGGDLLFSYCSSVCWNGSKFVAVGHGGAMICYSPDGRIWTPANTTNLIAGYVAVCWNGSMFVAGGYYGIVYSYDGITWGEVVAVADGQSMVVISAICWNGSKFVAVGHGGENGIFYSADGITWHLSTYADFDPLGGGIAGVCWNGSKFVAVGQTIWHSFDGETWETNGITGGSGICWNGLIFVVVGMPFTGGSAIRYSYDGITWANCISCGSAYDYTSVCWNGSMFVAGGFRQIAYSYNGITWVDSSNTMAVFSGRIMGICSANAPHLYPPIGSDNTPYPSTSYNITFDTGTGTWYDDTSTDLILSVYEGYIPMCSSIIKAPAGYYFTGWSPSIATATEDKTYTAQYAILLEYNTVYFDLAGGTWTGGGALSQSVADNGYATEPTMNPPVSNHPDHRNFTFIGWDTPLGPISGNTTITALWQMNDF